MMFRDFLLVGLGSFLGGGMRFLLSTALRATVLTTFPLGTFCVNVLGCLLIGFLSAVPTGAGWLSPSVRLLLTTGFCGGFTTFSTLMGESASLLKDHHPYTLAGYLAASLALGFLAVVAGQWLGRQV